MDREPRRGFQYHASLPYKLETSEEALDELNRIVSRIEHLYRTDQFQQYEFGTAYAYDAAVATRELLAWQAKKLDIPLEIKLRLTTIYSDVCFNAIEPSLMVRYGAACMSLWKSSEAKLTLRTLRNVIDWNQLAKVVRNVMLFQPTKNTGLGSKIDGLGQGFGNDENINMFGNSNGSVLRSSSQLGVALSLACLFRCTVVMDEDTLPSLTNDILSFLGPHDHEPPPNIVIDAFVSLIPYNDPNSAPVFIPMLFDLWNKVTLAVASLHIMPGIAEFVEQITRNGTDYSLTTEQLNICFQSVLHSFQIPLLSAQKSKLGNGIGSGSHSRRNTDHKSSRNRKGTINSRPFGTHSGAFAKLVVWSMNPLDNRTLELLDSLVNTVLSFCHPSNIGPWTALIFTALVDISTAYTQRLNQEEEWQVPKHLRLTSFQTTRLVEIIKKPVFLGIHNQAPYVLGTALETLRGIAALSPEVIVPPLLGEIYPTLQHGLHQPHRMVTSLACLSRIVSPLMKKPQYKLHLTTLLELSLPNLDANESKRCLLALALFQTVASVSTFADESDDVSIALAGQCLPECVRALEQEGGSIPSEIADNDEDAMQILKGTTAAYPEILSLYMRRIFEILETTTENRLALAAPASVLRVLLACSPPIFERLLEMTIEQITNPHQQSHDAFAQVCGAFVRANCYASFFKFWNLLSTSIREEVLENQAGSGRTATAKDSSLLRYLSVLNMCLLAANSEALVTVAADLRDLLHLLRAKTNVSVIYTVANTLHHSISALVSYSVMLPGPLGTPLNCDTTKASINEIPYLKLKWNVPSTQSMELAADLFKEHVEFSEAEIRKSIDGASTNVADEDAVSNALIFIRTATGSISPLGECNSKVVECRRTVLNLISFIYQKLSRDNVSCLKEVLFVAKVLLCDVGYERTARLDSHQMSLYQYEKRAFYVPGMRKRSLPPVVMARRAQLYHHQRLALRTRNREYDEESRQLILDVVVDACFSAYPAVKRNAFSALYSPLKIFASRPLYAEVYEKILVKLNEFLREKEYERAEGGLSLLKYRSFGLQTVGQVPRLVTKFVKVVSLAAASDHRQLSTLATYTFFMLVPDALRVGMKGKQQDKEISSSIEELVEHLTGENLDSLHWREALFRASALLGISHSPGFPLDSKVLKVFLEGNLVHHPDVRTTSILGSLNMMQKSFRLGFIGYDFSNYKCNGDVEMPFNATKSNIPSELECDWTSFFNPSPLSIAKAWKTQPRPIPKLMTVRSQGWLYVPQNEGIWRSPALETSSLSQLKPEDNNDLLEVLKVVNTSNYWKKLIALQKVEPRAEDDRMSRHIALLFRNLITFASMGYCDPSDSVETLLKSLENYTSDDLVDKNWHRAVSELACGFMLATPILNTKANQLVSDQIVNILKIVLKSVSQETIGYWLSSLSFALSNVDHRRLLPVIEFIESSARPETSSDGGGIKLSLRMELFAEIISVIQWHRPCFNETIKNWSKWNHSLQTTRESSADIVSVAATSVKHLNRGELDSLIAIFDWKAAKVELSLLMLTLRLLQLLGGDACMDILVKRAFPLLLKCSAIRDDPEVVVLVSKLFAELANTTFSTISLPTVSQTIVDSTRSSQWHQRMRMLLSIQSFFFNHLLVLDKNTRMTVTFVVVDTLSDPQAEVRDLASDTLSGIVRCSPLKEQQWYISELTNRFKPSIGRSTGLLDRHAAVLCLGALIGAFPYTSPPPAWVPDLLAALAVKAAGDSGIVGKSAKQILSDFKKTRQDTWHIDQTVFTQDQLDDLDGVLWKNYFA